MRLVAVISLNQKGRTSRSEVGGKGFHLCELIHMGMPVPPTWVVPVSSFRRIQKQNPREPDPMAWRIPVEWLSAWEAVAQEIGVPMAVRSSAPVEDSSSHSFAGQFETVLNVSAADLEGAIRRCWVSAMSSQARQYAEAMEVEPQMAVVIQPMVEAVASGVLFTINPMSGSWREMSVEAVWGQCEGLVSGQISPHWFLVRRPRGRLARVRMGVIQEQIHPITSQVTPGVGGSMEMRPVPTRRQNQATLRHAELFRLCRMGIKLERYFECPQDVEWAKTASGQIVLLQSRPITTTAEPRQQRDVVWTRRFLGERWPERATPLGWSLVSPVLDHFIAYPDTQRELLGGGPALRMIHSRPYINASVFPHLAFKLPGMPAPHFLLELMPPDEVELWRRKFAVMPDLTVYRSILKHTVSERRWRRFRWNPLTNYRAWSRFETRGRETLGDLNRTPDDTADGLELVDAHLDLVREYVGIHVCSILFANIWDQVLEGMLSSMVPERARALHRGLATCPEGNQTLACNAALYGLAQTLGGPGVDTLASEEPLSEPLQEALDGFLSVFGNRSEASWEIFSTRWREAPEQLVPYLRSYLSGTSPEEVALKQQVAYRAAEEELANWVSGPRLWSVRRVVGLLREYLLLRENQRFFFEELFWSLKRVLLWIGSELVGRGLLREEADIRFLDWETVRQAVGGELTQEALADLVQNAQTAWEDAAQMEVPDFLRGDQALQLPHGARRLQGLGISSGRVRGTVRVLQSPNDGDRLRAGDILVARSVDPGWTPLFSIAGGLILELGGRLSHGAVVAREYQLPGVVQISGATQTLKDGQQVILDGRQGVVWLET